MKNTFKLMLLFIGLSVSCSYNGARFSKAEKYKIMPGVPSGTPFYKYELDVHIKDSVQFLNVNVNHTEINTLSITNLDTNLQSYTKVYGKGNYRLSFKTYNTNILNNTDTVTITYKYKNRKLSLEKIIDTTKLIKLR